MLNITRRIEQAIILTLDNGKEIWICVQDIYTDPQGRQTVKFNLDAPKEVNIMREEILDKTK